MMRRLAIWAATALIASLAVSCRTTIPKWDGKLYAGDSATSSVQRSQDNEVISCAAPEFDDMICMTQSDFKRFYETYVLGCRQWNRGLARMSVNQAWAIIAAAQKQNAFHVEFPSQVTEPLEPEPEAE